MSALSMSERMTSIFSPCIRLYWRGRFGKLGKYWYPDTIKDERLLRQFMDEAGLRGQLARITEQQYDSVLCAAGIHGYSIETIDVNE